MIYRLIARASLAFAAVSTTLQPIAASAEDRLARSLASQARTAARSAQTDLGTIKRDVSARLTGQGAAPAAVPQSVELLFDRNSYRTGYSSSSISETMGGLTLARTCARGTLDDDGSYRFFPDGRARITMHGVAVSKTAFLNKVNINNATPVDTTGWGKGRPDAATSGAALLSLVNAPPQLIAAGFGRLIVEGKINGNVIASDARIGGTPGAAAYANVASSGAGNLNPHFLQPVIWRDARASAVVRLRMASTTTNSFSLGTTPALYTIPVTPAETVGGPRLQLTQGGRAYIAMIGLYEAAAPDLPTLTYGASAAAKAETALPHIGNNRVVAVAHRTDVVAAKRTQLLSPTTLDLKTLGSQSWGAIGSYGSAVYAQPARAAKQYIVAGWGQSNMVGGDTAVSSYETDNDKIVYRTVLSGVTTEAPISEYLPFTASATSTPWTPLMYTARRLRDFYNASKVIVLPDAMGGTSLVAGTPEWGVGGVRRTRALNNLTSAIAAYPNAEVIILWSQGEQDAAGGTTGRAYHLAEVNWFETIRAIAPKAKFVIGGMVPEWMNEASHAERIAIEAAHKQTAATLPGVAYVPGPVGFAGAKPNPGLVHFVNAAQPIRGRSWADQAMALTLPN